MTITLPELRDRFGMKHPVRVIHSLCGNPMFFTDGVPRAPGVLNPQKVVLKNGAHPRDGDPIVCDFCGYKVPGNQLTWVINDDDAG